MMIKKIILIIQFLFVYALSSAQMARVENYGEIKFADDPKDYDQMATDLAERNSQEMYELFVRDFINLDREDSLVDHKTISDEVLAKRLKMLATEVQLPYNKVVKGYMLRYSRPNSILTNVLGVGKYYFPMIEQELINHGLPVELKMLPVIESALVPKAKSHASAVGLWQFMARTGKYYGLEINSFVDERQDPVKSTIAACKHLEDLYRVYKDWTLVIAAYNCGIGNVNKAINRVPNAKNYWDIWEYLPRETRGYVPAFIGATYGYTFFKVNNISIKTDIPVVFATDTVQVSRMMHLDQVADVLNVSKDLIRELNPQYIKDIIPAITEKYSLVLPQAAASQFWVNYKQIVDLDSVYLAQYNKVSNLKQEIAQRKTFSSPRTVYKVKSGDTLGAIAVKYDVKVAQIQKWNSLKGTNLKIGQRIEIF